MRGFPFHGALEGDLEGSQAFLWVAKRPKFGIHEVLEPRSVLDHRSPSPPVSTATLSSSLGGSGSSDTAGVAAVSDSSAKKSVISDTAGEVGGGAGWKEEWAAELQPIPAGLDVGFDTNGAKCGLGVVDWETMLSENSAVSPVREQTFLGWIMGDVDDPASARLRQQQILPQGPSDFGGNNGGMGLGILDPSNCRVEDEESIAVSKGISVLHNTVGGGLPFMNNNSCVSLPSVGSGIKGIPMIHQAGSQHISQSMPPLDNNFMQSLSFPPGIYLPDTVDEKLQLFGTGVILNQQPANPNPPIFLSVGQAEHPVPHLISPTQPKCHLPMEDEYITKLPFLESGGSSELFPRRQSYQQHLQNLGFPLPQLQQRLVKPKLSDFGEDMATPVAVQQQQLLQALVDQLIEAAKMVEAKNFDGAHGILARLNHQLPSPLGKPLIRSTFYFKEALQHILCHGPSPVASSNSTSHHQPGPFSTPMSMQFDIVHKLGAYKAFSEVSPIIQFSNFTCIQALLEELRSFDRIHIVDFDIGVGGQWSSFMQELAQRRCSSNPVQMLKISVLVSDYLQNNLELQLVRDSLSLFANDLDIPFEFYFHSLESFDPLEFHCIGGEAIAVNLPIVGYGKFSFPSILCLVKQLSPKIVISVDQGCDRSDLPFLQHFLHAFQSSMVLMDSIDASGTNQDMTAKIEKFLLQPRIKSSVLGRYHSNDKILPWRTLFTTSGFIPIQLSNFLETQADCLLKRVQVRGFHVEKRQSTIYLYWQRKELISVSAWRC
ncbi:GRAS family protein RAM1-like [Zingiber officinale]|uniref:Scarecrow-like protein 6 n=1 Tax=Zingiber officinale TaxID=94328 RepID=A0A8J5H6T0_ZINOF|nr:GRAS family protein RAM1-like [Zingiber officinale]KAG6510600.1 hypothetical protein ZIOFF_028625 [Zingiber officinale]